MRKTIFCMMFAFVFSVANVSADTTNDWTRFQNSETNNGVTTRPGPTDQNQAVCIWENNMETPNEAKTPPVIVGDYIYTACQNKTDALAKAGALKLYLEHLPKNYKLKIENIL